MENMEKNEILAKARAEKTDEREIFINDRSMRWTYLIMALSAGIFTIVRAIRSQPMMDLCATVCLSVGAGYLYKYIKARERANLIIGIVLIICGVAASVQFFLGK